MALIRAHSDGSVAPGLLTRGSMKDVFNLWCGRKEEWSQDCAQASPQDYRDTVQGWMVGEICYPRPLD